jgi:hypothetical protein
MPDDDKPNPIEDLRKGLGLLFRAARTTIEQLPTDKLEEAVISGAKEVGRAIENVAQTVEQQVFRKPTAKDGAEAKPEDPAKPADPHDDAGPGGPKPAP